MGRSSRLAVVGLTCLSGAGCSLLVDATGLSGTAPPTTEAGSNGDGAVADSGSESSTSIDAGEAGLCDDTVLCDDFEGVSTVPWKTLDDSVGSGGTLVRDTVRPRSGMRSLHCARTTPKTGRAFLRTSVAPATLTCELDAFAEGVPAGENVEVLTLRRAVNGFAAYEPGYVFLRPSGAMLGEYKRFPDAGVVDNTVDLPLSGGGIGRWVHLKIVITGTSSTLEASADDAPAVSRTLTLTESASPPTEVEVGITYGTNGATPTVFVDNVVCRDH